MATTRKLGDGWLEYIERKKRTDARKPKGKPESDPVEHENDIRPAPVRKEWKGGADITLMPIDDVIVPQDHPDPSALLVDDIADSIQLFGLIHPIAIRANRRPTGKVKHILIAGHARLAAYKKLGETVIPCTFFPDDEVAAKYIGYCENLFRKNLTVLEEAEEIGRLVYFLEEHQIGLFGQNVQNVGRPLSAAGKAAKQIGVKGKTEEARKKKIERSLKINLIPVNVKEVIRARKLDNNLTALLEIAREDPGRDQYKAAMRLGRKPHPKKAAQTKRIESSMPPAERPSYEALLAGWEKSPEFRKAWQKATKEHRERFINEILRGPSGTDIEEVVDLVKRAFAGRQKILVRDLQRLGEKYGYHKSRIQKVARELGYKRKRLSRSRHDPWYYMNADKKWKTKIPQVSDSEFEDHTPPKIDEDELVLRRSSWETQDNPREEEEEFQALLDQLGDDE
jgi:ParB-like nuclease domain